MNYLARIGYVAAMALAFQATVLTSLVGSVSIEGVLMNSGEQGETLARFGNGIDRRAIGLAYDGKGSLWSGGMSGEVIRYTIDGRQLASYRTPEFGPSHTVDRLTLCDDALLLKLGGNTGKLYALPLDAEPGSMAQPLNIEATRISCGSHNGRVAALSEDRVFWVNSKGDTEAIGTTGAAGGVVGEMEVGPEGEVYLRTLDEVKKKRWMVKLSQPDHAFPYSGARAQWLNDWWFTFTPHGTIRRFDRSWKPDPGVVLGGASGSFIGYLPGNYELTEGRGMVWLGGQQYAVLGVSGIIHVLVWDPQAKQFAIARRIGPLRSCNALALDRKGQVWVHGGVLQWDDGPDAAFQHSISGVGAAGGREPFAAVPSPNGGFVSAMRPDEKSPGGFAFGTMDGPANRRDTGLIQKDFQAATLVHLNKRPALFMVNAEGKGIAIHVTPGGRPDGKMGAEKKAGDVILQGTTPISKLASLTSDGKERVWAGVDGHVVEFTRNGGEGELWQESRRWREWVSGGPLGSEVHVAWSDGRLWIVDTEKHRILLINANTGDFLAQVGTEGKPGNDLASFDSPRTLAVTGHRGVVFDSGNQRLIKMEWKE